MKKEEYNLEYKYIIGSKSVKIPTYAYQWYKVKAKDLKINISDLLAIALDDWTRTDNFAELHQIRKKIKKRRDRNAVFKNDMEQTT